MTDLLTRTINEKLPYIYIYMTPEARRRALDFLAERERLSAARERADVAWAEYDQTWRWRFVKRHILIEKAVRASAVFFAEAGDMRAAKQILGRIN